MTRAEDLFDQWAQKDRDLGMESGHLPRALPILEGMPIGGDSRALDLGCGNAWAARWILQRGAARVSALDAAPTMVRKAKERSPSELEVKEGDFESLPFDPSQIDLVFSMEALYYARDLGRALREIHRVLDQGGELHFGTDFYAENPHCLDWPEQLGVTMKLLTETEWRSALAEAGFKVLRSFRAFDPRPIPDDLDLEASRKLEHFRKQVGTLAFAAARSD